MVSKDKADKAKQTRGVAKRARLVLKLCCTAFWLLTLFSAYGFCDDCTDSGTCEKAPNNIDGATGIAAAVAAIGIVAATRHMRSPETNDDDAEPVPLDVDNGKGAAGATTKDRAVTGPIERTELQGGLAGLIDQVNPLSPHSADDLPMPPTTPNVPLREDPWQNVGVPTDLAGPLFPQSAEDLAMPPTTPTILLGEDSAEDSEPDEGLKVPDITELRKNYRPDASPTVPSGEGSPQNSGPDEMLKVPDITELRKNYRPDASPSVPPGEGPPKDFAPDEGPHEDPLDKWPRLVPVIDEEDRRHLDIDEADPPRPHVDPDIRGDREKAIRDGMVDKAKVDGSEAETGSGSGWGDHPHTQGRPGTGDPNAVQGSDAEDPNAQRPTYSEDREKAIRVGMVDKTNASDSDQPSANEAAPSLRTVASDFSKGLNQPPADFETYPDDVKGLWEKVKAGDSDAREQWKSIMGTIESAAQNRAGRAQAEADLKQAEDTGDFRDAAQRDITVPGMELISSAGAKLVWGDETQTLAQLDPPKADEFWAGFRESLDKANWTESTLKTLGMVGDAFVDTIKGTVNSVNALPGETEKLLQGLSVDQILPSLQTAYHESSIGKVVDLLSDPKNDSFAILRELPSSIAEQFSEKSDYYQAHPEELRADLSHFAGNTLAQAAMAKGMEAAGGLGKVGGPGEPPLAGEGLLEPEIPRPPVEPPPAEAHGVSTGERPLTETSAVGEKSVVHDTGLKPSGVSMTAAGEEGPRPQTRTGDSVGGIASVPVESPHEAGVPEHAMAGGREEPSAGRTPQAPGSSGAGGGAESTPHEAGENIPPKAPPETPADKPVARDHAPEATTGPKRVEDPHADHPQTQQLPPGEHKYGFDPEKAPVEQTDKYTPKDHEVAARAELSRAETQEVPRNELDQKAASGQQKPRWLSKGISREELGSPAPELTAEEKAAWEKDVNADHEKWRAEAAEAEARGEDPVEKKLQDLKYKFLPREVDVPEGRWSKGISPEELASPVRKPTPEEMAAWEKEINEAAKQPFSELEKRGYGLNEPGQPDRLVDAKGETTDLSAGRPKSIPSEGASRGALKATETRIRKPQASEISDGGMTPPPDPTSVPPAANQATFPGSKAEPPGTPKVQAQPIELPGKGAGPGAPAEIVAKYADAVDQAREAAGGPAGSCEKAKLSLQNQLGADEAKSASYRVGNGEKAFDHEVVVTNDGHIIDPVARQAIERGLTTERELKSLGLMKAVNDGVFTDRQWQVFRGLGGRGRH